MILKSKLDESVNFIDDKKFECRFVRRDNYGVGYLSTFNGCNQSCRMCHLTQTGQTTMLQASYNDLMDQAIAICRHIDANYDIDVFNKFHWNFMARGEPLLSNVLQNKHDLWSQLRNNLLAVHANTRIKISTILPDGVFWDSIKHLDHPQTDIYYSIYSVSSVFRKRWLPKAMPIINALAVLSKFRQSRIVFHYALIAGENDGWLDTSVLMQELRRNGFRKPRINLVRYNPYGDKYHESENYDYIKELLELGGADVKIVPRVGYDIKASCGMFV